VTARKATLIYKAIMEFDKIFEISDKFFLLSGVNVNCFYQKSSKNFKNYVMELMKNAYFILILINYLISVIFLFAFIGIHINHLSEIFECVMISGIVILYAIKILSVWMNQDKIRNLKSRLRELYLTSETSISLKNDSKVYFISEKISTRLLTIDNLGFSLNACVISLTSNNSERLLVYKIYVPYNYQPIVPYIFTMIWQIWVSLYCCIHEICTSGLLHGIVMILASEFEMIGDSLRNIDYTKEFDEFKKIIQKYQKLIEIAKDLESIFSYSNFATFIGTMVLNCFTIMECFTNQNQLIRNIVFSIFVLIMINQIFFLSYYCQKLESASESVGEKLLKSNWYEVKDPKIRMAVHFSLMRAQKPVKLTAAKFADINLETLKNVSFFKI
jgi:hypothetical protein